MKIELAKHSGFCFGVKQAVVKAVEKINRSGGTIFVYGPLIHNPQTVTILENRGLKTINSLADIDGKQIAIRTHGIPVNETKEIAARASGMINLTCPKVAMVQATIKKHSAQGCHTIILGDKEHAEVVGLKSFASAGVTVISSDAEISDIPAAEKYLLVAQTTFDRSLFDKTIGLLKQRLNDLTVVDTICDSTSNRQNDVREGIARGIDTLIVAGGKNSANTTRLAEIGRESGIKTFHIETEQELPFAELKDSEHILVTAGASTPGWIINNVLERLNHIKYKKRSFVSNILRGMLEFLVRTNCLSAAFAFFATLFVQSASGASIDFSLPAFSGLYIFSMYSINNYFDRELLKTGNSYKYRIYKRYGGALALFSVVGLALSFWFIKNYSFWTQLLLVCSSICGFLYFTTPVRSLVNSVKSAFVKNLYGSKIVTVFGWLAVVVIAPALQFQPQGSLVLFASALLVYLITMRHLLISCVAYQGDFIFGRLSLSILLGIKGGKIICVLLALAAALTCGFAVYASGNAALLLLLLPIVYYIALFAVIMRIEYPVTLQYEILIDLNLIFTAALLCIIVRI